MSTWDAEPDGMALPNRIKRKGPWWKSAWFDTVQFVLLSGLLVWFTWRGAAAMDYRWQWNRLPRYFWRVIDGELIWGPFITTRSP